MTTIRETIVDSLPGAATSSQYVEYVDAVDAALTEREYVLSEQIATEVSQRLGVDKAQVEERLTGIGMAVRPAPEPEPEPEAEPFVDTESLKGEDESGKGKGKKRIKALEEKVDTLAGQVAQLVTLAQNRLGARL